MNEPLPMKREFAQVETSLGTHQQKKSGRGKTVFKLVAGAVVLWIILAYVIAPLVWDEHAARSNIRRQSAIDSHGGSPSGRPLEC